MINVHETLLVYTFGFITQPQKSLIPICPVIYETYLMTWMNPKLMDQNLDGSPGWSHRLSICFHLGRLLAYV